MKFIDYLKDLHASNYSGTDDNMPEDFERWLGEKNISEEAIEMGEKHYKSFIDVWEKEAQRVLESDDILGFAKAGREYMAKYNALPWYRKILEKLFRNQI